MKINDTLPPVDAQRKGEIALRLITEEMIMSGNLFGKSNSMRRHVISRSKDLQIPPNELLSMLQDLLVPHLELLFKPITSDEVTVYEKERDERRQQKEQKSRKDNEGKNNPLN